MTLYFHAATLAFFNTDISGTHTLEVDDPAWVRPMVDVPDPAWKRPRIRVIDADWDGRGEPTFHSIEDPAAVAPTVSIQDIDTPAPQMVIPNPDCTLLPNAELVEIPPAQHATLFAELCSTGKPLGADAQGYPVLLDVPPLNDEQRAVIERDWRDHHLASTDTLVARHRDEVEAGLATSLSPEQYTALQRWRLELRGWPEAPKFPDSQHRPVIPIWLADPEA